MSSDEQKTSAQEDALRVLRDQIDSIDLQVQQLINQRARCAQRVAEVKQQFQGAQQAVFYRPEREAQVLRSVMARNEGPLPDQEMARLFREIMSVCLALEQPLRVVFLGPEGTFTQQAVLKHFGHAVKGAPLATLDQVFRDVESGTAHYGVVPIESANEGAVSRTLDLFSRFDVSICGEVELQTHYHLLADKSADLTRIKRIYAQQFAFSQCHHWLETHYPDAERIPVVSNADAAEKVAVAAGAAAAIGSDIAAELFDLVVAERNIEDQLDSVTRYLIIGNQDVSPSGQDKTSILLLAHDKPGVLYDLLEPFRRRNISLTRLETRSGTKSGWDTLFYIDFEGHRDDPEVQQLLQELEKGTVELKQLGSYPKAVL